jgi:L-cysteine:1D-myo-inositol 2-amino-2-deoxy-alpha-D-glucopyranoside ligase
MDAWQTTDVPVLPGHGPEPRLRDTATGELTVAAAGKSASLYACGITPYDATHIGHAATYVAWDLLVRAWLDAGHDVRYTQNVTDVDDPLLERADRDGEDWRQLAAREIERFRGDMEALRVIPPQHLIGAVEAIPVIDEFAERLASRGALYDLDGDTYFARGADAAFGALSGPNSSSGLSVAQMTELSAERGGDPERPGKKDPLDPLIWRAERPGEPAWDSRFGRGRPGWHVECAAIATEYLGPSFDVQAGGSDLVFPHHEMSASHTRVAYPPADGEHVFARVYAHSGMVAYQGAKMSKSLGNLVFVSRLRASGTDPMAIRLALLAHHYRSDWEWTDEALAEAEERLGRWRAAVRSTFADDAHSDPARAAVPPARPVLDQVRERLADDLDAPGALAVIDSWVASVLSGVPATASANGSAASAGTASAGTASAGPAPAGSASVDSASADPASVAGSRAVAEDVALIRDTADALLGIAL